MRFIEVLHKFLQNFCDVRRRIPQNSSLVCIVGVCSCMRMLVQSEEVSLLHVLRVRRWWRRRELLRAFVAERARHAAAVNASGSRGGRRLSPVRLLLLLLLLLVMLGSGGGEVDGDGGGGGEVDDAQRAAALNAVGLTRDSRASFALVAGWQARADARCEGVAAVRGRRDFLRRRHGRRRRRLLLAHDDRRAIARNALRGAACRMRQKP